MSVTDPCMTDKKQFLKTFLTNDVSFPQQLFTNYHKFGDLKHQKCILSRFWRPKPATTITGLRSRYWNFLQRLKEEFIRCLFQKLAAAGAPQHMATSPQSLPLWPHYLHSLCQISLCFSLMKTAAAAAESPQSCPTLCDLRLPRPWDSPGKNTGVGCHFLLQCMKVKSESEVAQLCPTLSESHGLQPDRSSVPGIFQTRALEWGAIALSAYED